MTYEYSCGAVVFTRVEGVPHFVLIRAKGQPEGRHGFPKGHMEPGETEEQTALREIYEEVGLRVRLLPGFRAVSEYDLPHVENTRKRVVFFLGEYENQTVEIQESEVVSAVLAPWPEALKLTEFEDSRRILTEAHDFLTARAR